MLIVTEPTNQEMMKTRLDDVFDVRFRALLTKLTLTYQGPIIIIHNGKHLRQK